MSEPGTPPQSLDAERSILGSVLLGGTEALDRAKESGLQAVHFYAPAHEELWRTFELLAGRGQPIDSATVLGALPGRQKDVVGPQLADMVTAASFRPMIEAHAVQVVDAAILRELSAAGQQITQLAQTAPLDRSREAVDRARGSLDKVETPGERSTAFKLGTLLPEVLDEMEGEHARGLTTGIPDLDTMLGGGPGPGQVMIVGARPSVGKTMLGLNLTAAACEAEPEKAATFFSLEMTRHELTQRLLARESSVGLKRIRAGQSQLGEREWSKLANAVTRLDSWPLVIDDDSSLTVPGMRARLRRIVRRQTLSVVVVDYLQLVEPEDRRLPREQQIASVSRAVKRMAKDFMVPVVLMAQLSRETDKRRGSKPMLSDLRESGSIENDADIVVLLHPDDDGMGLIVAKNRQGERGEVFTEWESGLMQIGATVSQADREAQWQSRMRGR